MANIVSATVTLDGVEHFYRIGSDGRVWSKRRMTYLRPAVTKSGEQTVKLAKVGGGTKTVKVSDLMKQL